MEENEISKTFRNNKVSGRYLSAGLNVIQSTARQQKKEHQTESRHIEKAIGDARLLGSTQPLDAAWLTWATGLRIHILSETNSTNTLMRAWADEGQPQGTVLLVDKQTGGRGRLGRHFFSPTGTGLYMSLLLRPMMSAEVALMITTAAAVAVAEAVTRVTGRAAGIKWVNDILLDGKKICGILTETALDVETGGLQYAVLGIGINCWDPIEGFPSDIREIAGSVFGQAEGDKNQLAAEILRGFTLIYNKLPDSDFMERYRELSVITGKNIWVMSPNRKDPAKALSIDDRAGLRVQWDDGTETVLRTGEISIRERK